MIEELKVETTEERREEEKRMKKKRGISRNCPYAVCSSSVRLVPRDILDGFLFPFIELSLVYVSISPIGPSNASFRFISFHRTHYRTEHAAAATAATAAATAAATILQTSLL